jgi:hypothetical protein
MIIIACMCLCPLCNGVGQVVRERERFYRAPLQRIAGWRENPTVYGFGYLWTVHSLYYWWRDQVSQHTPPFLVSQRRTTLMCVWYGAVRDPGQGRGACGQGPKERVLSQPHGPP